MTLERIDAHRIAVRFGWSNSALFTNALDAIKATLGREWHKQGKYWSVPVDHTIPLARKLQAMGCTVRLSPTLQAELSEINKYLQRLADIMFIDEPEGFVVPSTIVTKPRPYQEVAALALGVIKGGALLADPVGVGKTYEAILDHEVNGYRQGPDSILWIVPSSLRRNVRNQYRLHMGLADDEVDDLVTVIGGPAKKRKALWEASTDIKIVGYEMYFQHDWAKHHVPREWNKVYADEITKIKNRKTKAHERMRQLNVARGITGMTATPIEMSLEDAYQIMDVLRPGVLGQFWQFRDMYLLRDRWGKIIGPNPDAIGKFSEAIAPYMIKRDKAKLMPWLPPKVPIRIDIALSDEEMAQYNDMADNFTRWVNEHRPEDDAKDGMTRILRLRQFTNSPNIVDPTQPVVGEKMRALIDILDQHAGETVVIFTQWVQSAERIAAVLREESLPVELVKGGVDIFPITERINAGEYMVLVTTDSAAYGFDMYGAHVMVHYDGLWNPAKMTEQREGRLHRGDQQEPIQVYTLAVNDTFEMVVLGVMESRKQLADAVYDGAEIAMLRRWSADDWTQAVRGVMPERMFHE